MLTEQEQQAQADALAAANAKLAKAEEERENYRKGLLIREEELKKLKSSKEEDEDEEDNGDKETEWDDNSKKFQEETLTKTAKVAEEAAVKALELRNDKTAQQEFRESHPEIDDEKWAQIVANYNPKNGKDSIRGIVKDLERAYVVYKFDAGETIDPVEIARQQADFKNKEAGVTHGTSSGSGKMEEEKGGVSDGAKKLAGRFGIPVDKLEKEDDSRFATVSMTKR